MNNINNDQRILQLKEQIKVKKEKLNKTLRFAPVTNCSIELDKVRYNIQVLSKEELTMLMIRLNTYVISAKDLGIIEDFLISGYKLEDWIKDIKSKIEIISRKDEERTLKSMEDKLMKLLSDGKKVELELDDIENSLRL